MFRTARALVATAFAVLFVPGLSIGHAQDVGPVGPGLADGGAVELSVEKRADIEEVRNYRVALTFAADAIADRPLSDSRPS